MATVKIIIRKENGKPRVNSKGETALFVQYCHNEKTILFSTQTRIHPEHLKWDGKNVDQREPIRKNLPGYTVKNSNLRKLFSEVDQIKDKLLNQGIEPTVEAVKQAYEEKLGPKKEEIGFFPLFEKFIEESKAIKAVNTIKQYTTALNHLKEFEKFSQRKITFAEINLRFYDRFVNYLISDLNMSNNTVGTQVKDLKSFLNHAKKRGLKINDISDFKVLREKPTVVYLSQDELQQLYTFDFKGNLKLEKSRDLFCLQASTGLRISDLFRLGKEHIQDNSIRLKAHKTKTDVIVPLTPMSLTILEKYNYELPEISEVKQNLNIKEACQKAGLNRKIEMTEYRGGRKEYKTYFLYEVISSHNAIKTFITHCIEKGLSPAVVAKITGKTTKVLLSNYYSTHDNVVKFEMEKAFGVAEPQLKVAK